MPIDRSAPTPGCTVVMPMARDRPTTQGGRTFVVTGANSGIGLAGGYRRRRPRSSCSTRRRTTPGRSTGTPSRPTCCSRWSCIAVAPRPVRRSAPSPFTRAPAPPTSSRASSSGPGAGGWPPSARSSLGCCSSRREPARCPRSALSMTARRAARSSAPPGSASPAVAQSCSRCTPRPRSRRRPRGCGASPSRSLAGRFRSDPRHGSSLGGAASARGLSSLLSSRVIREGRKGRSHVLSHLAGEPGTAAAPGGRR